MALRRVAALLEWSGWLLLAAACSPGTDLSAGRDTQRRVSAIQSTNGSAGRDTSWLLGPDPVRDAVRATDSESTLVRRYGRRNVRRGAVDLGEGDTADGTILFPDDSTRRVEIQWADSAGRSRPIRASIGPAHSRWLITPGITIGTSLESLQRLNGVPFELTGLEGHSGGLITDWGTGSLSSLSNRVFLRLAPAVDVSDHDCPGYGDLQSGWGKRSSHRAMRCAALTVYSVEVIPR